MKNQQYQTQREAVIPEQQLRMGQTKSPKQPTDFSTFTEEIRKARESVDGRDSLDGLAKELETRIEGEALSSGGSKSNEGEKDMETEKRKTYFHFKPKRFRILFKKGKMSKKGMSVLWEKEPVAWGSSKWELMNTSIPVQKL